MAEREKLGKVVRAAWVAWASNQPDPPADWLVPWELLDERYREVDRQIGEAVALEVRAEAVRLVEDALFLRMHGERPPGAPADPEGETWGDWDRRAEEFLRRVTA